MVVRPGGGAFEDQSVDDKKLRMCVIWLHTETRGGLVHLPRIHFGTRCCHLLRLPLGVIQVGRSITDKFATLPSHRPLPWPSHCPLPWPGAAVAGSTAMFIGPWESGMSVTSLGLNCVLICHAPCCANL